MAYLLSNNYQKNYWNRMTTVQIIVEGRVGYFSVTQCRSLTHTHTHTHLTAHFPGLPRLTGTRKVKPIWILLKQETVSGSSISWAICKSAPRCRQITMPAPHNSLFTGWMPFLQSNQQRQSTEGRSLTESDK